MSDYLLYSTKLAENDNTLEDFAKYICKNLDIHYDGYSSYDEFKDETMDYIQEYIREDINKTDIDYEKLMYKYRGEIGDIMYELENQGYENYGSSIFFFG